ncbi:hypothetical protein pb186bvf_007804 [Paramecium bursaria]
MNINELTRYLQRGINFKYPDKVAIKLKECQYKYVLSYVQKKSRIFTIRKAISFIQLWCYFRWSEEQEYSQFCPQNYHTHLLTLGRQCFYFQVQLLINWRHLSFLVSILLNIYPFSVSLNQIQQKLNSKSFFIK